MEDGRVYRVYEPWELAADGYPRVWRELNEFQTHVGVKDLVRADAGYRCVRCKHPYRSRREGGEGGTWTEEGGRLEAYPEPEAFEGLEEYARASDLGGTRTLWSRCDARCEHTAETGPVRTRYGDDPWAGLDVASGIAAGQEVRGGAGAVEAAWRILTVHHLNERKFDLRWHNLVALCQRCHLNVQRRVRMDRAYPWEHSDWFRPYVAAFYAAKYLGEELSREETEARLPELLALGREEESVERMAL